MSGTSTPRGDRSPHPDAGGGQQPSSSGPSPLTIGKRFVKQYYQMMMTTPDQIHKFYQPKSVLSDGEGSTPTDPVSFESAYAGSAEKLKDRFVVKDFQIRFEFEHGAIDAQESVNGGLLLVVTGHVVYYPNVTEDEDAVVDEPIRKGFVHTFFLNVNTIGTKKSYYVHNDILRYLKNISDVASTNGVAESAAAAAPVVTETQPPSPATTEPAPPAAEPVPETKSPAPETQQPPPEPVRAAPEEPPKKEEKSIAPAPAPAAEEAVDEAPGGGVEETKEEPPAAPPAPAPAPPTKPAKEDKPNKKDNKKDSSPKKEETTTEKETVTPPSKPAKSSPRAKPQAAKELNPDAGRKSPVPPPSPAPKPPPGSWASLVAGAGGTPASASSAVKSPPPPSTKPPVPKPTPTSDKPPTPTTNNDKKESSGDRSNQNSNNNANNTNSSSSNTNASNSHKMGSNNNMRPPKRDPDCTLVIKNLAEHTKEQDVLGLFEPFAAATKARVVGITVAAHRGIAFVDYDSINPVMKAVKQHQEEPMQLFGRVLEVDQKTAEQRARRMAQQQRGGGGGSGGGGGNYRGQSPNHNGGVNRYDSRGRGGHRRRDGRGDRGGGMGGRGGRGRGGM